MEPIQAQMVFCCAEQWMGGLFHRVEPWGDGLRLGGTGAVTGVYCLPAVDSDKPTVIIGHTVKGHGVSFMENNSAWHAGCVSEEDWIKAKDELTAAYERKWGAN